MAMHEIDYKIFGDDMQFVEVELDPGEALRQFGWRPSTSLATGIAQTVAWYREHGVEQTFTHLAMKT